MASGPASSGRNKGLWRLPSSVRAELLLVLQSPSEVRADVIRQMFQRDRMKELAEVLMDLEADDRLRDAVIGEVRRDQ